MAPLSELIAAPPNSRNRRVTSPSFAVYARWRLCACGRRRNQRSGWVLRANLLLVPEIRRHAPAPIAAKRFPRGGSAKRQDGRVRRALLRQLSATAILRDGAAARGQRCGRRAAGSQPRVVEEVRHVRTRLQL